LIYYTNYYYTILTLEVDKSSDIETGPEELEVDVPGARIVVVIVVVVEGRSGVVSSRASVGEKALLLLVPLAGPGCAVGPGLVKMPCSRED